jgi:RNA polymerase II subunit A small phosphatase-like protein
VEQLLLILDLDETLIHARGRSDNFPHDFTVGPYFVRTRPHLDTFLRDCATFCRIAVWSSAGAEYVNGIVERIMPKSIQPTFIWSRDRCVSRYDHELQEQYFVKDFKKLKRQRYDVARALIVDDEPRKLERNYGNAIYVRPFTGSDRDDELPQLLKYLKLLCDVADVRAVEKRDWRSRLHALPGEAPA